MICPRTTHPERSRFAALAANWARPSSKRVKIINRISQEDSAVAAEPPVFTEDTRLVFVGGFGSLLQLMAGLLEQFLGFCGMP